MLDWAGESQYYVEPKRLARLGYLDARKEPGKTRERTVYTLTEKGLVALREYARIPVHFTPVKSEPLLRLMICDLVDEVDATSTPRTSAPRAEQPNFAGGRPHQRPEMPSSDMVARRRTRGSDSRSGGSSPTTSREHYLVNPSTAADPAEYVTRVGSAATRCSSSGGCDALSRGRCRRAPLSRGRRSGRPRRRR
jgi:hypothetical protein